MINELGVLLARHPVIMAIYGIEQLSQALNSIAPVCILANIDLLKLQPVIDLLNAAGKKVIVNIDSCRGLSQDKGGVEYVAEAGAIGLLSTRVAVVQSAKKYGLIKMQKVFVTDRSTWLRSLDALQHSEPDYVQLMPATMLAFLSCEDRRQLPPVIASGFVSKPEYIHTALSQGAVAVSTSDNHLWNLIFQ